MLCTILGEKRRIRQRSIAEIDGQQSTAFQHLDSVDSMAPNGTGF
jgi:hypothetical protein